MQKKKKKLFQHFYSHYPHIKQLNLKQWIIFINELRICSPDIIHEPLILHSYILPEVGYGDAATKRLIGT